MRQKNVLGKTNIMHTRFVLTGAKEKGFHIHIGEVWRQLGDYSITAAASGYPAFITLAKT